MLVAQQRKEYRGPITPSLSFPNLFRPSAGVAARSIWSDRRKGESRGGDQRRGVWRCSGRWWFTEWWRRWWWSRSSADTGPSSAAPSSRKLTTSSLSALMTTSCEPPPLNNLLTLADCFCRFFCSNFLTVGCGLKLKRWVRVWWLCHLGCGSADSCFTCWGFGISLISGKRKSWYFKSIVI